MPNNNTPIWVIAVFALLGVLAWMALLTLMFFSLMWMPTR